ncbi:MAG: hypothetical protein O7E57_00845, partial [Gammaproteobacteria bacterium]|nr:hypothetical protein [Gammaproteobacteria bacterium]
MKITKKKEFILTMLLFLSTSSVAFTQTSTLVAVGSDGRLVYTPDSNGNIVPDFSGVGYKNSEEPIPMVPVVLTVSAVSGDNTANVQLAIETVAAMAIQANGFRGAILFQSGTYEISGVLTISATGIVLRGQGNSTIFLAKGTTQYDFIEIGGSSYITEETTSTRGIVDSYVPYGVDEITVESGHTFSSGDQVLLHRIPNQTWIDTLGMNASGINWTPSQRSIKFQRRVVAVNGDTITLDAPVVDPIDPQYATATLTKFTDNRINNVGIENMRLESDYDTYPHLPGASSDENHAWAAIAFSANIRDAWVRSVDGYYFGYGLIDIADNAAFITIEASNMYDPVSITTGGRKYPFSNDGQRILFKDCFARGGRHSLETGSNTAGPVVFTNCSTQGSLADDGPHHRWSTGILYDNIQTERLNFQNRGTSGTGHGWAAG